MYKKKKIYNKVTIGSEKNTTDSITFNNNNTKKNNDNNVTKNKSS